MQVKTVAAVTALPKIAPITHAKQISPAPVIVRLLLCA
jgi:hypothetical protein